MGRDGGDGKEGVGRAVNGAAGGVMDGFASPACELEGGFTPVSMQDDQPVSMPDDRLAWTMPTPSCHPTRKALADISMSINTVALEGGWGGSL